MATIEEGIKLDYSDVLICPKRSDASTRDPAAGGPEITRDFKTRWHKNRILPGIPIIASNMDHTGTVAMAHAMNEIQCFTALHKYHSIDTLVEFLSSDESHVSRGIFLTFGVSESDEQKLDNLLKAMPDWTPEHICLDVANGYQDKFVRRVEWFRTNFPNAVIMAGNVVTTDMVQELIMAGADIVKIGIGPGSVCTTRKVTGVGYPQFSAVLNCAERAHGLKGLVCADGGCTEPGDVAKALGAGADFVMLGGMLAGHDQCRGDVKRRVSGGYSTPFTYGEPYMEFYGMSSKTAMLEHGSPSRERTPEGKAVKVPYRGDVRQTMKPIIDGVLSAMTYVGADRLKDFSLCTTFIKVKHQINNIFS